MAASASFASVPRSEVVAISAANTNRDGTGTIVAAFTTGASGSRIERIEVKATGTTTAGMVRSYKKEGAGAWQLWKEYVVSAITPGAAVATFRASDDEIGEILETNFQVGFSTHNAEGFNCHISGGDF